MGHCAEQHKDVPDGMKVLTVVMSEEIGAYGVEYALCHDAEHSGQGEALEDGLNDQQHAPPHEEIQGKRETGVFAHCEDLVEHAADDDSPLQSEYGPPYPAPHDRDADGRVGAGYHDVDGDMVELAQHILALARPPPVVEGAAEEHEEHADDEEYDTEGPLPAFIDRRPYHPDGGEGKDNTDEVGPGVALLRGMRKEM